MKTILIFLFLIASIGFSQAPYVFTRDKGIPISIHYAVPDTNELKILQFDVVGNDNLKRKMIYLQQLSSSDSSGSGWFESIDSLYAYDGIDYFEHPDPGRQWARIQTSATDYAQLRSDISDSLGIPNFVDTTQMKTAYTVKDGIPINLKQLSSTNTNGGGYFVQVDSSDFYTTYPDVPEGVVVFDHPTAGKKWVRDFSNGVDVTWAGAMPDSSADAQAAMQKAAVHAYYLKAKTIIPSGIFKLANRVYLPPHSTVVGSGMYTTEIYLEDDLNNASNDCHFSGWKTSELGSLKGIERDTTYNEYYIGHMTLVGPEAASFVWGGSIAPATNAYNGLVDGLTGDDGGIYMQGQTGVPYQTGAVIEYIRAIKCGLGIQPKMMLDVQIRNCIVTDCNWAAYTPVAQRFTIENCYSDSTQWFMESLAAIYPADGRGSDDSLSFATIKNNVAKNFYYAGMMLYSWNNAIIEGNEFYGGKTTPTLGSYGNSAIWIKASRNYLQNTSRKERNLLINNNVLTNTRGSGISFSMSGTGADSILGNVKISDNIISENYGAGITFVTTEGFQFETDEQVERFIITDNFFHNNGIQEAASTTGVLGNISWSDSAVITNNIAYRDTFNASSGRLRPLMIRNSDGVLIENNDFRTPALATGTTINADSASAVSVILRNNQGLDLNSAIAEIASPYRDYYQDAWYPVDGGIGLGNDSTGFIITVSNDSLFSTAYNNAGTAGTKTRLAPNATTEAIVFAYSYADTDTVSVTGGSWSVINDGTGNFFTTSPLTDFTESGDTLYYGTTGLYAITMQATWRVEDSTYIWVDFSINKSSAGVQTFWVNDTNYRAVTYTLYTSGTAGNPLYPTVKTNTSKDIIFRNVSINAVLIRED